MSNERSASSFRNFIKNLLRRGTYKWQPRSKAIAAARIERGKYKCAQCLKIVGSKDYNVDHVKPVVPTHGFKNGTDWDWNEVIDNMYPEQSGWQVLCTDCHDIKTKLENDVRYEKRRKKKEDKKKA